LPVFKFLSLQAIGVVLQCLLFGVAYAQTSTQPEALHAVNRLSFGPTPGEVARVMQIGVDRYVDEQLNPERLQASPQLVRQLESMHTTHMSQDDLITQYRDALQAAKKDKDVGKDERREMVQTMVLESGEARLLRALQSPRQLEEVMVDFWFNHFNVFSGKGLDRVLVENYEREAIRPYAMGNFRDLLGATAHHPAMLFYLDNWLSVAPGYQAPRRTPALAKSGGLNENYARELMELHTLGVDGGYSQSDVTELARMLTGWTINPRKGVGSTAFYFDASKHDRGTKVWLGQTVSDRGQAEGEWALDVLAASPATAHHISSQLAQYFVSDVPPAALVDRLTKRFEESHGDIRSVLKTLFTSAEFRDPKFYNAKFKTPYRYLLSSVRASGLPITNLRPLLATAYQLGMPLYGCQTPDGYKNTEEAWLNPDAITRRVNFAVAFASGKLPFARPMDPNADAAFGIKHDMKLDGGGKFNPDWATAPVDADALLAGLAGSLSPATLASINQSEPRLRAALVLGSPDFMRH
jgi:uncharacterized protein (DUF1800 family)